MDKVDLTGAWTKFLSSFGKQLDDFFVLCAFVGVIIAAYALGMWLWKKKSGGSGGQGTMMMLVLGAFLASPKALIPFLLMIIDFIVNLFITFVGVAFPS